MVAHTWVRLAANPGVGGGGEVADGGGEGAVEEIGDGDLLKDRAHIGAEGDPDVAEGCGGTDVLELLGTHPADIGKGAIDDTDDVGEADLIGGAGEAVAAADGAALAVDDTGVAQLQHDVFEELEGDPLGVGDGLGFDGAGAGAGQLGEGT